MRNRTINPRSETEKIKRENRNQSPVGSVAQPISARVARQENRRMAKQVQEQLAAKQTKQTSQMEPKRVKDKLAARQTPEMSQMEQYFIDETVQSEREKWRTSNPSFRTPCIISQEALMAFLLAAVGIERILPVVNDNQDSTTKTIEEVHAPDNLPLFFAPVIHPTTGEIITSYKRLVNNPKFRDVWETGFGKEWGD